MTDLLQVTSANNSYPVCKQSAIAHNLEEMVAGVFSGAVCVNGKSG